MLTALPVLTYIEMGTVKVLGEKRNYEILYHSMLFDFLLHSPCAQIFRTLCSKNAAISLPDIKIHANETAGLGRT
jgi:hypothetical protein